MDIRCTLSWLQSNTQGEVRNTGENLLKAETAASPHKDAATLIMGVPKGFNPEDESSSKMETRGNRAGTWAVMSPGWSYRNSQAKRRLKTSTACSL